MGASLNDYCTRFHSEVAVHSKNQELVDGLPIIFVSALNKYNEANGKYPYQIVVFRDGVADGQMEATKKNEAGAFKRMFEQVGKARFDTPEAEARAAEEVKKFDAAVPSGYDPGFNFIVVQKRINTRIFSLQGDPKAAAGKSGQPRGGHSRGPHSHQEELSGLLSCTAERKPGYSHTHALRESLYLRKRSEPRHRAEAELPSHAHVLQLARNRQGACTG